MVGTSDFGRPRKRSVTIAGHETSVSLEPIFWKDLERTAAARNMPLNALIAEIDARRVEAPHPPNLTSALRQWLFAHAIGSSPDLSGEGGAAVHRKP